MWKNVFPEYAVKQAFHEYDLDRGDEHIVTAMQTDLLTRILFNIIKGSLIHCVIKKRKYINEQDLEVGKSISLFQTQDAPKNAGHLLDSSVFYKVVNEHIELCKNHISKYIDDYTLEQQYKISAECLTKLQTFVESMIRGFVYKLSLSANGVVNYKLFENVMANTFGDPSYLTHDNGFTPHFQSNK